MCGESLPAAAAFAATDSGTSEGMNDRAVDTVRGLGAAIDCMRSGLDRMERLTREGSCTGEMMG